MAEFVAVMSEARRLCRAQIICADCPLKDNGECMLDQSLDVPANFCEAERRVMNWAEQHPRKTMLDVLMEMPTADVKFSPDGSVRFCPSHIDRAYGGLCADGKGNCRECWGREVGV